MNTLGQFILFCASMLFASGIIRLVSLMVRYFVARRLIAAQFRQAIVTNEHISPRNKIDFGPEIEEIAAQIFVQMCHGLKYQRKWMIRHAVQHMAVLYQTTVWLTNDPDDLKLYAALDVVKQKFYYMHGTFLNIKKNKLRNHINMQMYTTSGDHLTSSEDVAKYDKKEQGEGCRIKITMSIVTPLTPRKYDYEKYI